MNGAEFRCAREYLGLPATWVAEKLGVVKRTVSRYEHGNGEIPETATLFMESQLRAAAVAVGTLTVKWEKDSLPAPRDGLVSPRLGGYPPSWHRMVCSRVVERTGKGVVWVDHDPESGR